MKRSSLARSAVRSRRGSVLSEAGPAFFILFIFAVFPVMDLIFMGLSYSACASLNSLQLREIAKVRSSQASAQAAQVTANWKASGLGHLACVNSIPIASISYKNGEDNAQGTDVYVNVVTRFTVQPLLTIPFFAGVPGLGSPMQWTISGERLMENPHYAAE